MNKIPTELIEAFAQGNGAVFVGAGLSIGIGYPGWMELVSPLADEVDDCPPRSSAIEIAQYFVNQHGRQRLVVMLREKLSLPPADRTPVHDALVDLPLQRIFTTNFDRVIEETLSRHRRTYDTVVHDNQVSLMSPARMQVLKLHGDFSDPESIVLTQEDFDGYTASRPAISDLLKVELQSRAVLFLGYGHSDPDLNMILSRITRESRALRRNLFSIQFAPSKTTELALQKKGIVVVPLECKAGDPGASAELQQWLEEFARRVREAQGQGSTQRRNHNLPPRPIDLVGRVADRARTLEGLHARTRYPLISIEGFAGIGKTSLAVEVGYVCAVGEPGAAQGALFDFVVWISAKDKPDQKKWLNDVLNAIAITINFPVITQLPVEEIERKKTQIDLLIRTYRVLVIVDNLETIDDPELIAWMEQIPEPSKVLVTTRNKQLHQKAWSVQLTGLDEKEATALLRQHAAQLGLDFVKQLDDAALQPLYEVTGGNPQAMKLALGLVGKSGPEGLARVVSQLHMANPQESMDAVFDALFAQSWKLLGRAARDILLVTPLFVGVSSIRRDALQAVSGLQDSSFDFSKGLAECERLGLLEAEPVPEGASGWVPRYAIHSMTRAFARHKLDEAADFKAAARHRCTAYFLELVRRSVERREPSPRYWNALVTDEMLALDPEWPSIEEVMHWTDEAGDRETLVEFVMLLVHYMDSRFLNRERLAYVHKALAGLEALGRREDEALLRIDALGWTYVEEDRLDDAYDQIETGYRLAEEHATDERDDLRALGLAWRARVRIEQGRIDDAETLITDALAIDCRPWIKCRVYMAAGDIALKQKQGRRALDAYVAQSEEARKYGDEGHGYQWRPRIGMAQLELGDLEGASRTFQELHRFKQIAIGRLYAEYGLAMIEFRRGDVRSARAMIDDVRARLKRRTSSNLLLNMIDRFYRDLEQTQGGG